jgi:hypothetical protein
MRTCTQAYIGNAGDNSVSVCFPGANGALSGCTDAGATGIAGNNQGFPATYGRYFYLPLGALNTMLVCTIDPISGQLSDCSYTGSAINYPSGFAISAAGDFAYISSYTNNQILTCPRNLTTGLLSACTLQSTGAFASPAGLTLDATATYGYVVYDGSNVIGQYPGDFNQTSPITTPTGSGPSGVVFTQGYLFVTIPGAGEVLSYAVDGQTGALTPLGVAASGFTRPLGITAFGGNVYVVGINGNQVYTCTIQSGGTLDCPDVSTGINLPVGIVMSAF